MSERLHYIMLDIVGTWPVPFDVPMLRRSGPARKRPRLRAIGAAVVVEFAIAGLSEDGG